MSEFIIPVVKAGNFIKSKHRTGWGFLLTFVVGWFVLYYLAVFSGNNFSTIASALSSENANPSSREVLINYPILLFLVSVAFVFLGSIELDPMEPAIFPLYFVTLPIRTVFWVVDLCFSYFGGNSEDSDLNFCLYSTDLPIGTRISTLQTLPRDLVRQHTLYRWLLFSIPITSSLIGFFIFRQTMLSIDRWPREDQGAVYFYTLSFFSFISVFSYHLYRRGFIAFFPKAKNQPPFETSQTSIERGDLAEPTISKASDLETLATKIADSEIRPYPALTWGNLQIRDRQAAQHFFIHGEIGSGKTILLKHLMAQVLDRRKRYDQRIRIFIDDPKRDIIPCLNQLGHHDYAVINPFDQRAFIWNLHEDLRDTRQIDTFVTMLFPEEKSSDSFWPNNAREALSAVITYFIVKKVDWDLRDLILAFRYRKNFDQIASATGVGRGVLEGLNEKQLGSVRADVRARLGQYRQIAIANHETKKAHPERTFSVTRWAKREGNFPILVFPRDEQSESSLSRLCRLFFFFASKAVLSGPEINSPITWFFVDEAKELADMPELSRLADVGRSKGATLCLATQSNLDFMDAAKTNSKAAARFATRIPNKALLKTADEDAQWSSTQFGKVYRTDISETAGYTASTTYSKTQTDAVAPHIFNELPKADPSAGVPHFVVSDTTIGGGAWFATLPFDQWPPAPSSENGYIEKGQEPELEEWGDQDLIRLGLKENSPKPFSKNPDTPQDSEDRNGPSFFVPGD